MFCEKCGKKVSYKKAQCDHCKHPVKYESFSKFEYEKVVAPAPTVSAVSTPEAVSGRVAPAPAPKNNMLIIIASAVAALVLAIGITGGVLLTKDKKPSDVPEEKTEILSELPEYEKISADAKLSVIFEEEPLEEYTYTVEIVSQESDEENNGEENNDKEQPETGISGATKTLIKKGGEISSISPEEIEEAKYSKEFAGDEKSEGKLCEEGKRLKIGECYTVTVKGDGKKTKDATVVVLVSDDKDAEHKLVIKLEGYSAEELYEREVISKNIQKEYCYLDLNGDGEIELLIKDGREYTVFAITDYEVDEVKNGSFEADKLYYNNDSKKFYCMRNGADQEKTDDDVYYQIAFEDDEIKKTAIPAEDSEDLGGELSDFQTIETNQKTNV